MSAKRSLQAVWFSCFLLFALRVAEPPRHALSWDVFGYYLYLPATFLHHDIGLQDPTWLDHLMEEYAPSNTLYQLVDGPDGKRVIKYSSGMAVVQAPFFLLAHAWAHLSGHPADGLSPPYQWALTFGCLLFALWGLFLLRRLLLYFFSDEWTAVLILLLVFGTNYLQLTAWDGTLLTHSALFTLYAALLLATVRWHERPTLAQALLIGLSAGLITLIRPSEGICVLLPLCWMPATDRPVAAKWALVRRHLPQLLAAAVAFLLVAGLQCLYWKAVTGQWLFYSYQNPGEGFDLASPYLRPFLFSFRKGWLLYTPLMALALLGLFQLWKDRRHLFPAIASFLVLDLWIVASWSCWWYAGGSFSSRSMVAAYPVLALSLGMLLRAWWRHPPVRRPMVIGLVALVLLNLFQTLQWHLKVLPKDRVTAGYYAAIFGRLTVPPGAEELLLVDRSTATVERFTPSARYAERTLYTNDFQDRPDGVMVLHAGDPYSPGPHLPYTAITNKDHAWLRITARLLVPDSLPGDPPVIVVAFHHEGGAYKYRTGAWNVQEAPVDGAWTLTMDYLTPEVRSVHDDLKIYAWTKDGSAWRIDDLRVQLFEPR